MIFKTKSNIRKFVFLFIFLSVFLFANSAKASLATELSSGVAMFVKSITQSFATLRSDFCNQYLSAVSVGEWKIGELRVSIGKKVCLGFTATVQNIASSTSNFAKIDIPKITIPSFLVQDLPEAIKSSSTKNNSAPGTLVGNVSGDGSKLNAGQVVYWTNIERHDNAIEPGTLIENKTLAKIASIRVADMFANTYFEHNSPTGDNVSKEAVKNGYDYITIGENIALGNFDSSRDLVVAWMNSPGHRANILNKNYTEIGVYASKGMYQGQEVWIAAQIFGRPLSDCKSSDLSLKQKIATEQASLNIINSKLKTVKAEMTAMGTSDMNAYNAKVAEYNDLAKQYNALVAEIKSLTDKYNLAVQIFNACIKTE